MTRYTPPSGKSSPISSSAPSEAPDSKRWRYLMMVTSGLTAVLAITFYVITPSGRDLEGWAYAVFAISATVDLFFWTQWRRCLLRDDDAPSQASQVGAIALLFCAVYGFVAAIGLYM